MGQSSRAGRRTCPAFISIRTTPPMSSTPQAQQEGQKVWPWHMQESETSYVGVRMQSPEKGQPSLNLHLLVLTYLPRKSCQHSLRARYLSSWTRSPGAMQMLSSGHWHTTTSLSCLLPI